MNVDEKDVVVFKNKRREKDSHPHYVGYTCVDGVQRTFGLWLKTSKNPEVGTFMSGKLKDADEKPTESKPESDKPHNDSDFDDDIPF